MSAPIKPAAQAPDVFKLDRFRAEQNRAEGINHQPDGRQDVVNHSGPTDQREAESELFGAEFEGVYGCVRRSHQLVARRDDRERVLAGASELLTQTERWLPLLGRLVLENTISNAISASWSG